ncbi:hypothetical protein HDE69_002228 [Pedobacter cryoconitis]|uniref:Uncharacterized protein n=1 Tax=Pedobacter cryoconitis TaxID=188932 RepID=A0A7W9DKG6_9SPHI|nr:hypothetical protein [Pedobacter cryoconitis]MBB5621175.1 hypothetical protein [Pedobacter cryoconitis]MBB5645513.1 hypothetical protein [Pedobacter cryoconitis]
MNNFYFTTFKELLTIDHFTKSWGNIFPCQGEEFEEEAIFVVSNGDVDFPEHLRLDIDLGWKSNDQNWIKQFPGLQAQKSDELVEGILIFGNLSVKGSILNEEGDYGAFLYVSGQVTCQSFVAGGSTTYIKGNITTEEVFISHYNHGYLKCDSTVTSPVLIINDHYTHLNNYKADLFYYNDKTGEYPSENACYEDEETGEDWLCSPNLTKLLDNPTPAFEELIFDLNEGEYVFNKAAQLPIKDEAYWLLKAVKYWGNLKRIPEAIKTEYFFKRVYEKYGAFCFSYFSDTFLTQSICEQEIEKKGINLKYIPEHLITKDLCYLAAKHETNISSIPTAYLDKSLIKEVIHYNDSEMDNVPERFITEELLVDYVKLGRGLWLDKYCEIAKVSKITVLLKALDSGIDYIEQIWGFHFREEVYHYAKKLYDNKQQESTWNKYTEKFQKKIERLS